jgi:hypothetical protein
MAGWRDARTSRMRAGVNRARLERERAYQCGYHDGSEGHPLQFWQGPTRERYRDGWYDGYHDALTRDVREYNLRNGTYWEPRI